MDLTHALAVSQALGFAVAFVCRYSPGLKNKITPAVGYVTLLLTNIGLLWQKFVETADVGAIALTQHVSGVAYAGFFSILSAVVLKPILTLAQPLVLTVAQLALNRLFHEVGIKAVVGSSSPVTPPSLPPGRVTSI